MEHAALTDANDLTLLQAAALLSGSSAWDSRPILAAGIPSFVMSDGPHGVRRQLGDVDHLGIAESEKATCFPTASAVAATWNPELARDMGEALGLEARGLGVDVLLGPGLNIKRSPLCGRNFEYFSEDPILAGQMAAGLVEGIQSTGTAACPKHFAVNSQELRRMASDSIVDERTMREIYLTGFEIVCRAAKPRAIMSSYNLVNGTYAHENKHLLTDILRTEWGFDGMVVSDWGGSNSAVEAARAGGSLEMPAPGLAGARQIVAAVEAGQLEASDVYARAQEVLNVAAAAAGLPAPRPYDLEDHHELATRIASEAITLLRNNDDLLPLNAGTSVALIGDLADTPRFQGSGSSQVNPTRVESPRELLEAGGEAAHGLVLAGYARGYERHGGTSDDLIAEAVALAARADVALVYVGLDELAESEGLDRPHMRLPEGQDRLIEAVVAANPRNRRRPDWRCQRRDAVGTCRARTRQRLPDRTGRRQRDAGRPHRRCQSVWAPGRNIRTLLRGSPERRMVPGDRTALVLPRRPVRRLPLLRHRGRRRCLPLRLRPVLLELRILRSRSERGGGRP